MQYIVLLADIPGQNALAITLRTIKHGYVSIPLTWAWNAGVVKLVSGADFPEEHNTGPEQASACALNKIAPLPSNGNQVTINTAEALTLCSEFEPEQEGIANDSSSLSPRLRATFKALGMREEAFADWATFHVSTAYAMGFFFISTTTLIGGLSYFQLNGIPFTRYYMSIPCAITISITSGYLAAIWRYGPFVAASWPYMITLPIVWTTWSVTFSLGFLGPLENIPFGSFIHFLLVVGLCLFTGNLANKSGMLFMDHPAEPRNSMYKQLFGSAVSTVRLIDNFTDMSFVRIILTQVCFPTFCLGTDLCIWEEILMQEKGICQLDNAAGCCRTRR